jgi:hypothetical protein
VRRELRSRESAQGGNPEPLLPERNKQEDDANWSPDGKTIVLSLGPLTGNTPADFEILLVDVQSRQVSAVPKSLGLFAPRYSPDGRYISAFAVDGLKCELFDTRSKTWSDLMTGTVLEYPDWSRDSAYLYFANLKDNVTEVERVRIQDHKLETVASLKDIPVVSLPFGADWHGLTPQGSPLISCATSAFAKFIPSTSTCPEPSSAPWPLPDFLQQVGPEVAIDVVIRQPQPHEYDSVRSLIETVANETFGNLFAPNPVPLKFEDDDWSFAWVAVCEAKIVGVMMTHQEWFSDL